MVPVQEPKTYGILIADDLMLVREGLAALCQAQPGFRVVGQCAEGTVALRLIETLRPEIAVLDLHLRDLVTTELVRRVREANLPTKTVVLSLRRDRKTVVEALRCGVNAFLLKSDPSIHLLQALDHVLDGGIYISPQLKFDEDPLAALSAREFQIFTLMVGGVRAKEIAARLGLSPKTIDTYRVSMMRKLDIHDVPRLVKFAVHRNLTSSY